MPLIFNKHFFFNIFYVLGTSGASDTAASETDRVPVIMELTFGGDEERTLLKDYIKCLVLIEPC